MEDILTPIERRNRYFNNQKIDRLPVFLLHASVAPKYNNMTIKESYQNAENLAACQIAIYRALKCDSVNVGYGLFGLGESFGSKLIERSPNDEPGIVEYAINHIDEIYDLNKKQASLECDYGLQEVLRAAIIIHNSIGDEVPNLFQLPAPFTAAASIIEPTKIFRNMRKNETKVHDLLKFTTECLLDLIDDIFQNLPFLEVYITDPVASGTLISPNHYEEFVQPYTKKIVDRLHFYNKFVIEHICGDTSKTLKQVISTGIDGLSLDNEVDLSLAKEKIGEDLLIIGNVSPIDCFLYGNKHKMFNNIEECFNKASDSPKGFWLGSGCSMPYETPLENMSYFMEGARKYGSKK